MKVKIAPDFRDLFRPLTDAELEQAKANNLADPQHERVPPVTIWNGTVIDGHHTLRIRENLRINGKPAKIRYCELEFTDRAAAMAYAIQAQLGRRNLDPSQIAIALAKLPKNAHGGDRRSDQVANLHHDRETMAEEHGISERTLRSADKVIEQGAKAVVSAVASGDVTVSDAASIADLPKSDQLAALKKVINGEARTLKSASGDKGTCPNCGGKKWTAGDNCAKCNHPHGEPAGDVDEGRAKIEKLKWIKTVQADIRAADDTNHYSKQPAKHEEAIRLLKQVLHIAQEWPT